jgi:hypothetical protein
LKVERTRAIDFSIRPAKSFALRAGSILLRTTGGTEDDDEGMCEAGNGCSGCCRFVCGDGIRSSGTSDVMSATYPELAKKHGTDGKLTCAVCHPDKDKKIRNNYGAAFGKALTKKNETDEAKIKEALTKSEGEKSATDGKTFGDLIKAVELPGTAEAAK